MKKGKYRKGIFIVVYKDSEDPKYLIFRRKRHWKGWEFPKGGIEPKETIKKAILREIKEESHLKPKKIKNHGISGKYPYNKELSDRKGYVGQTYSLYSIEVSGGKVRKDSSEHSGYKWVNSEDALRMLTWPNQRRCLRIVNKSLRK